MSLVLDGVTLTMPPASLSGKGKHAAQHILHMWSTPEEKVSHEISTLTDTESNSVQKFPFGEVSLVQGSLHCACGRSAQR